MTGKMGSVSGGESGAGPGWLHRSVLLALALRPALPRELALLLPLSLLLASPLGEWTRGWGLHCGSAQHLPHTSNAHVSQW